MELKPHRQGSVPASYKQTEFGAIPEDWQVATLGETCSFENGDRGVNYPSKSSFVPIGVPFVNAGHLNQGRIAGHDLDYITEAAFERIGSGKFKDGDILFCLRGTLGKFAIVDSRVTRGAIASSLIIVRPHPQSLARDYLRAYFDSKLCEAMIELWAGGAAQPNLGGRDLARFGIPLPPTLAEQEAIAGALSDADALIDSLEQLIAKKRLLKQGAMQDLLTGKKRLPGFEGKWRTVTLGEVIEHCSSGATPYRGRPEYYKGQIKWISSGELNYNVIYDTIEHISVEAMRATNLRLHPAGTFLMAITGLEAAGTRGACGIVGSPATTNQSCMAIYPTKELLTEYLFYYYVFRGDELALSFCQGTKQQSYTAKLVKILPIDLPPTTAEQTAIAAILSDMDAEIAALEAKLAKARQMKQGMMQELLTGRIRLI